jgi:hypothetical protein
MASAGRSLRQRIRMMRCRMRRPRIGRVFDDLIIDTLLTA